MKSGDDKATLFEGVVSLLAALMCGWLGMVACISLFVLAQIDVFLMCCLTLPLVPICGFVGAKYGWRNTKSGRPEWRPEPPLYRSRIMAIVLVLSCAISPRIPQWLGSALSSKPSQARLEATLRQDQAAYERISSVLSQHPQLECVDRMSTGNPEPFPALDGSPAHRDEIRQFMRDHPEVERIDRSFQSGVLHFQLWSGKLGMFDFGVRGFAFSASPPPQVVGSLDSPDELNTPVDTLYEHVGGRWYLFETSYSD